MQYLEPLNLIQCRAAVVLGNPMIGAANCDFLISPALRSGTLWNAEVSPFKEGNLYCYRRSEKINCSQIEDPGSSDAVRKRSCQGAFRG